MAEHVSGTIAEHSAELSDACRRESTYSLIHFVVNAISAVICGADDIVSIAEFGRL